MDSEDGVSESSALPANVDPSSTGGTSSNENDDTGASVPLDEDLYPPRCEPYPYVDEVELENEVLYEAGPGRWRRMIHLHEDRLFWWEDDGPYEDTLPHLMVAPSDGSAEPEVAFVWELDEPIPGDPLFDGDRVFLHGEGAIWVLNWRSGGFELVFDEPGLCEASFRSVAQNADSLFFTVSGSIACSESSGILRIDKETYEVSRIEGEFDGPVAPAISGDFLYYADAVEDEDSYVPVNGEIYRLNLTNGEQKHLGTIHLNWAYWLHPFDGGVAYRIHDSAGPEEIWHLSDEGEHKALLSDACESAEDMAVSGENLYFLDNDVFVLRPGESRFRRLKLASVRLLDWYSPALTDSHVYYIVDNEVWRGALPE